MAVSSRAETADYRIEKEDLVDGAANFVAAEGGDDPLDVPPMTETRDIAVVARPIGPRGRLEAGIVAKAFDEVRRIG
jgi:hypothetical protein